MTNNNPVDLSPHSSLYPQSSNFSVQLPESSTLILATFTPQILLKLPSISPQWPYCRETQWLWVSFPLIWPLQCLHLVHSILFETFSFHGYPDSSSFWFSFYLSGHSFSISFMSFSVLSFLKCCCASDAWLSPPLIHTLFLGDLSMLLDPVITLELFSSVSLPDFLI